MWTPWLLPFSFFLAFSSPLVLPTCLCASNWSTFVSPHYFWWALVPVCSQRPHLLLNLCMLLVDCPQPTPFCLSPSHSMGCTRVGALSPEWVSGMHASADVENLCKFGTCIRNSWEPNLSSLCAHVSGLSASLAEEWETNVCLRLRPCLRHIALL